MQQVGEGMAEAGDLTLSALRATICEHFPEHGEGRFSLLTAGWDCVAVDVDDRRIFKFPRHERAAEALVREAALLAVVRARVEMPLPDLRLHPGPPRFSHHPKIAGQHLVKAQYQQLPEVRRQQLGEAMALFYAQLHALPVPLMQVAGAGPVEPWLPPEEMLRRAWPALPPALRDYAAGCVGNWQALPPDPHGSMFGYFDGHGWNMAFDHAAGRLNGLYDFGDAGIGELHREFIYSNWISRDLTARIVGAYEGLSGKVLDRDRIELLSAVQRVWELAEYADDPSRAGAMVQTLAEWAVR